MKKPLFFRIGIRYAASVIVVTTLLFSCSSSGSSSTAAPANDTPTTPSNGWIDLKPISVAIPEDTVGQASLTRNFYFIMDGSGSMGEPTDGSCGGDQSFANKMIGARWAIKKFLENVPDDVNIGLYVFDSKGQREVVPLGSQNREAFIAAVDDIREGGGTPLAQAIKFGTDKLIEQYKTQLGYGEYRLVAVTDGKASGIPQAAVYAAQRGIPIYAIGLCVGQNHPLRHYSVSYRAADNFADLSKSLSDTLAELPNFDVSQFEEQ